MKNVKDFMPSDESEIEDLRKMQGPPTKEVAEALAIKKAWDDYYEKQDKKKKESRDNAGAISSKASKNAGDYGARMKRYDKAVKDSDALIDKMADEDIADYKKRFKGSKKYESTLKDISATSRKKFKGAKPLSGGRYKSGGVVRGSGKARGVKPCKIC